MTSQVLERLPRGAWLAWLIVSIALLVFTIFMTFGDPRPYHVQPEGYDLENDFVYNSRLILDGSLPFRYTHPGTPVQYLGAALMGLIGSSTEKTQTFLNISYFLALLALIGALAVLTRLVLVRFSFSIALLALASIVAWPPFLTFMNHWGSEMFLVVVGLPAAGIVWAIVEQNRPLNRNQTLILGVLIGLGVSIKITFAPLAVVLVLTAAAVGIRSRLANTGRARFTEFRKLVRLWLPELVIIPAAAGVGFLIAVSPAFARFHNFPATMYSLLRKSGASENLSITGIIRELPGISPVFTFIVLLGLLAIVISVAVVIYLRRSSTTIGSDNKEKFNHFGAVVFLVSMLLVGLVFLRATSFAESGFSKADPGVRLRELTGIAMVLPFLVLYCQHLFTTYWSRIIRGESARRIGRMVLTASAIGTLVLVMGGYGIWRSNMITEITDWHETVENELEQLAPTGTRIVIAELEHGGEALFHLQADYIYASDYFEDELTSEYPRYAMLRFEQLAGSRPRAEAAAAKAAGKEFDDPVRFTGLLRIAERMVENWRKSSPLPNYSDNAITGGASGAPVSVLAYSDRFVTDITPVDTEAKFHALLEKEFGKITGLTLLEGDGVNLNIVTFDYSEQ